MRKVLNVIWAITDTIKNILFNWGLKILLVLFFTMVIHNLLKLGEVSTKYSGEYKNLTMVDYESSKMMNIYQTGEGEKTIVILPGFGMQSPVIQYKALANELNFEYKVVIVEYFGYGYSMDNTKAARTNMNIANEVMKALNEAEIPGPYVFLAHSISNMYAMKIQELYPDLVEGIIALDGLYPAEINDEFYLDYNQDQVTNININSVLELSGFQRLLSYIYPKAFNIDKMQEMKNVYTEEDIKIYRNRIANSYLTRTMTHEINTLIDNMKEMRDYKYPSDLHVLNILSQERYNQYEKNKSKGAQISLDELAAQTITNNQIQEIVVLSGSHDLQITNLIGVGERVKDFFSKF